MEILLLKNCLFSTSSGSRVSSARPASGARKPKSSKSSKGHDEVDSAAPRRASVPNENNFNKDNLDTIKEKPKDLIKSEESGLEVSTEEFTLTPDSKRESPKKNPPIKPSMVRCLSSVLALIFISKIYRFRFSLDWLKPGLSKNVF